MSRNSPNQGGPNRPPPSPADLRNAQQKLDEAVRAAQQGNLGRAAALFEQAVRRVPLSPDMAGFGRDVQVALGNQAFAAHRHREALAAYRAAHGYDPGHPGVLLNIGNTLVKLGALTDAADALAEAVARQPDNPEALLTLAAVLAQTDAPDRAEAAARCAAALAPGAAPVWFNLGNILKGMKRLDSAMAAYRRACTLAPERATATVALIQAKQLACDWTGFDSDAATLEALAHRGETIQAAMLLSHRVTPAALLAAARAQARTIPSVPRRARAGKPGKLITVGYLSNDFRQHPVAQLLAEVLALHDRGKVRVIAYSHGADDGSLAQRRIRDGVDRFLDIGALSDDSAAEAIRRDGVDVLVDLKGYTERPRLGVLAKRPAAVQVGYLGYPGTTGADWLDYVIADAIVLPPDLEAGFSEAAVRLPTCFLPRDRRWLPGDPPSRTACGLPEGAFVLAGFNPAYKITPDLWDVWMGLLRAIPDAVLWLQRLAPEAEERLRREAAARGIGTERLVFAPWADTVEEHLTRLQCADLVLDTLYYGAHTTASDALWAGVPVVTCPGAAFQSRVAASLLHAAGLDAFVAGSLEEYARIVLDRAADRDGLRAVREALRGQRDRLPVFDMPAYTRSLESAFATMLETHRRGEPPRPFAVPATPPLAEG